MPLYENEKCPVCNKKFADGDDIVVCPKCATPHHRECYNSLGHCANRDMHGTDFEYKAPQSAVKSTEDEGSASGNERYFFNPEQKAEAIPPEIQLLHNVVEGEYQSSAEQIDGKSLADIAAVIRTNARRFIEKFKSGKRTSWNWGAFFFGPFYLFFRKMYKEGVIFMTIRLIVSLVSQGIYAKEYADLMRFIASNTDAISAGASNDIINQLAVLCEAVYPMFIIIGVANLIMSVIISLFADGFYKKRVGQIIDNVDKRLEEGAMFDQPFTASPVELSQQDMRTLYLSKMGGTSIFAPIMAYFAIDIITSIISQL
ncbi:MAG: RING finger protein [Eubacterium sp.]